MQNIWLASSLWIGLALAASIISIRVSISVALIEIIVGAIAGNAIGLDLAPWVNFLAGFGAIMLTLICSQICPAASSAARLKSMTAAMWSRLRSITDRSARWAS